MITNTDGNDVDQERAMEMFSVTDAVFCFNMRKGTYVNGNWHQSFSERCKSLQLNKRSVVDTLCREIERLTESQTKLRME